MVPNQYMAKINSHTKSQTGIVAILFSYFRVGVLRVGAAQWMSKATSIETPILKPFHKLKNC